MITLQDRISRWHIIQKYIRQIPELWILEAHQEKDRKSRVTIEECKSWDDLLNVWNEALVMTKELEGALACSLAVVLSTRMPEDQLWMKLVSVASSGKTTIAEALSTNRDFVYPKDSLTKFYSGTRLKPGQKDPSIIPKINGKTLIIKDGDPLLKAADRDAILAQARGLYDTSGRVHYNTHIDRNYENIRFSWILCGTPALRAIDNSELGERFLDYVITEKIKFQLEDKICDMVIARLFKYRGVEVNGTAEGQKTKEMLRAMALTGGYVRYLRTHMSKILNGVHPTNEQGQQCKRYARFVSFMRTRMDKGKDPEDVYREMPARLSTQHTKLALCLAGVMEEDTLSPKVMRIVKKVAMDTSRGRNLEIVQYINKQGNDGAREEAVKLTINQTIDRTQGYLRHLERNDILARYNNGYETRWRLKPSFRTLYKEVMT